MGRRIRNIITTALVALIVVIAGSLAFVRIFGAGAYAVLSGSMEPAYHVGSLLYTRRANTDELKEGDVITFAMAEDLVVTHRVVEVLPDESDPEVRWFRTKGDANDTADASPVHENNVIGQPVFSVPLLGYVLTFVKSPPGLYIAIAVAAGLILLAFLPGLKKRTKQ